MEGYNELKSDEAHEVAQEGDNYEANYTCSCSTIAH